MTLTEEIREKFGITIKGIEYAQCYKDVRKIMHSNIDEHNSRKDEAIKNEDWEYAAKHRTIADVLVVISGSMDDIFSYSS